MNRPRAARKPSPRKRRLTLAQQRAALPVDAEQFDELLGALKSLKKVRPEMIGGLSAAFANAKASGHKVEQLAAIVEVFRSSARSIVKTDPADAETLFSMAELMDFAVERISNGAEQS